MPDKQIGYLACRLVALTYLNLNKLRSPQHYEVPGTSSLSYKKAELIPEKPVILSIEASRRAERLPLKPSPRPKRLPSQRLIVRATHELPGFEAK